MKDRLLLLVVLAAALAASAIGLRRAGAQGSQTITITAKKFSYDPASLILKKGYPVTFILKNQDVSHGLRFAEFNVNLKANKGETAQVTFTPDKTGDFIGHCSVFCGAGHGSMTITLHVVE